MKRVKGIISAAALSVAMAVTSFAPVSAAPLPVAPVSSGPANNNVIDVQLSRSAQEFGANYNHRRWRGDGRHWRGDGRYWGGRPPQWNGPRYGWHNGHRGYRHKRPGYRYHDGWWFPAGAFVAGAIIGGALNNATQPPRYYRGGGSAHVSWCYNRYRSYREYDNTFQPYNGPRQQCYSPYS